VINVNRSSKTFGKAVGQVTDSSDSRAGIVRIDPSGGFGLVYDRGTDTIYFIDLVEGSSTQYESFRSVPKPAVTDIQISPTGKFASVLESAVPVTGRSSLTRSIRVTACSRETCRSGHAAAHSRVGVLLSQRDTVLVYAVQQVGATERLAFALAVSTPENPYSLSSGAPELPTNTRYATEHLKISPRGDRFILNVTDSGFHYYGREETPWENLGSEFTFANRSRLRWDFVPDASRFYVASDFRDSVLVYDFSHRPDHQQPVGKRADRCRQRTTACAASRSGEHPNGAIFVRRCRPFPVHHAGAATSPSRPAPPGGGGGDGR